MSLFKEYQKLSTIFFLDYLETENIYEHLHERCWSTINHHRACLQLSWGGGEETRKNRTETALYFVKKIIIYKLYKCN